LKKNEADTISALNFRGKIYLHRGLLLVNGNYLRHKFTVHKSLARSMVRGVFFSKYRKTSFEFVVGHWWDNQGWLCCTLTMPECPMNLHIACSFLPIWLPMTLIFILVWLLYTQHCSEPGCALKAGMKLLWKKVS